MIKYIQIGFVTLKIDIKKTSKVINNILRSFKNSQNKKYDGTIVFKKAKKRCIKIDIRNRSVGVTGPTLDDQSDHLLPIMIIQILFRFADYLSGDKPQLLLHASTSVLRDGNAILFGDDGTNIGKTTASVELGLKSKRYVNDEFSVYDTTNNTVLSFAHLPIHIRDEYLANLHRRKILINNNPKYHGLYSLRDLGMEPSFETQLTMIIYPKFNPSAKPKVVRLSKNKARTNLKILAFSHLTKLLHPKYDRISWFKKTDNTKTFDIKKKCEKLALNKQTDLDQILQKVASYSITFQTPSQIVGLVNRAVAIEQKKTISHLSASAVVYFKNKNGIKILLIKKNDGLIFLPKGHVNYKENPSDTALREAKEEAGLIRGVVKKKICEYSYTFTSKYGFAANKKTVVAYLVEGRSIKLKALATEGFIDAFLVSPSEAKRLCSFDDEKNAIAKVFK